MNLDRCNRYVFSYQSTSEQVRDYILRLADLAEKVYGRDTYFARFNQILDNARLLGWRIPRFGDEIPEPFQDLSPEAVDHIFENQAKILVDISPIVSVSLENEKKVSIRMVGGTTPANDLLWRCHLLVDKQGRPYLQRGEKRFLIKTRGTRIVCSQETQSYDERALREYFGGDRQAIWPVPFLPEVFSDHPIAQVFMAEGVIELVKIEEDPPVNVLAINRLPWYRSLELDRTKLLPPPIDDFDKMISEMTATVAAVNGESEQEEPVIDSSTLDQLKKSLDSTLQDVDSEPSSDSDDDFETLEEESEPESEQAEDVDLDEPSEEGTPSTLKYINIIAELSEPEKQKLKSLEDVLDGLGITSKAEAESLRKNTDPAIVKRAEDWLLAAVNRVTLLGNASGRLGAVMSVLQQHTDQPVVVVQPRQKWADKLLEVLTQRGYSCKMVIPKKVESQLKALANGKFQILVTTNLSPDYFLAGGVILVVSWFGSPDWVQHIKTDTTVYGISLKELGLSDINWIPEHAILSIETQDYSGPGLSLFKNSDIPIPKIPKAKKPKKAKKPRAVFKVQMSNDKTLKAGSLEKAIEIAKEREQRDNVKCTVTDPNDQIVYVTEGLPS